MIRRPVLVLTALALGACATAQKPASLMQAESLYQTLTANGADRTASGELLRAREAINDAQVASAKKQNTDFVGGLSHIALREAQTAQARHEQVLATAAADSLGRARMARLLLLSEAQRNALAQQNALSEAEIAALRERNMQVSQQAASAQQQAATAQQQAATAQQQAATLSQEADSLRRANEEANRRLNDALGQLRSLVTEITNLRETSRGIVISLSDILFDVNQATLKPGAAQNIARISTVLRQYPDKQIAVEGHTDSDGPDAYNHTLSERRAAAVREALVSGGVPTGSITSRGFGETQPVTSNASAAGKQQNRRVEIVVLGAGSMATSSDTTRSMRVNPQPDSLRQAPPR